MSSLLIVYIIAFIIDIKGQNYGIVFPTWQIAIRGNLAVMKCFSFGTVKWTRDSFRSLRASSKTESELVINSVKLQDSDTYNCYGSFPNSTEFVTSSKLLVGVSDNSMIDPPVWIGKKNAEAKLYCQSLKLTYWFFGSTKSEPVHKQPSYVIEKMPLKYNGMFYCYGTYKKNKHFIAEMEAKVYDDRVQPRKLKVLQGSSVVITCNSHARVSWTHNGENSLPNNVQEFRNNTIVMAKVMPSNGGYYECQGKHDLNKETFFAQSRLSVIIPDVKIIPAKISVSEGHQAKLHCISNSIVLWKFNDQKLPNNVETIKGNGNQSMINHCVDNWLIVHNISKSNQGQYTCMGPSGGFTYFVSTAIIMVKENVPNNILNPELFQRTQKTMESRRFSRASLHTGMTPIQKN